MSQANVDTVRRAVDAYVRGDLDEALANFHPEVVLKRLEEAAVTGRDAVRASLRRWEEEWDDLETIPGEFIDRGEHVVVPLRFRGRGRGSGIEIEGRYWEVVTLRADQVVRWEEFASRDEALAAAGSPE